MTFETRAQKALKQAGGRITDQRSLIIHLLANSTQQIDAESLYILAFQEDASISLATVYRTLNALADAGVIQRRYLSPEHNRQYFERVPDEHVLYITCRNCQKSFPVETDLIQRLREQLSATYDWHEVHVCSCISGLCADCYEIMMAEESEVEK